MIRRPRDCPPPSPWSFLRCGVEAAAVVADLKQNMFVFNGKADMEIFGVGVLERVGDRFTGDSHEVEFDVGGEGKVREIR